MNIRKLAVIGTALMSMSGVAAQDSAKVAPKFMEQVADTATTAVKDTVYSKRCSCQKELTSIYDNLLDLGKMPSKEDIVSLNNSYIKCRQYKADVASTANGVDSRFYREGAEGFDRKTVSDFNTFDDGTISYRAGMDIEGVIVGGSVDADGKCKFVSVSEGLNKGKKIYSDLNGDGKVDKVTIIKK
jgi:hypothetical protein